METAVDYVEHSHRNCVRDASGNMDAEFFTSYGALNSGERAVITGMHAIIYTRNPDADRAFFRDVLGFHAVDAGEGWLIFAAPPSEVACHPADSNDRRELYLMCDDIEMEIARLAEKGVACDSVTDEGWGLLSAVRLPGGGDLGLYEPRHPLAHGTQR
jgi:catechol 2,3-dioxygenase-like lactoylglutathione lyase family enzyme